MKNIMFLFTILIKNINTYEIIEVKGDNKIDDVYQLIKDAITSLDEGKMDEEHYKLLMENLMNK